MVHVTTHYCSSNRGIVKLAQMIICGVILILLGIFGFAQVIKEPQLAFCLVLTTVVLILLVIFFVLNAFGFSAWRLERAFAIFCIFLFIVAFALLMWYIIARWDTSKPENFYFVGCAVLAALLCFFFLWDVKILQGEASNW